MEFLVIGLGSMGKRRIRNLQYLGEKDIVGYDMRDDRRAECEQKYKIKTLNNINKAMDQNPDVFIISTPPNHHIEYEILAAKNNKHFFCEAGVFTEGIEGLIKICKKKKIVAAPSATLRFNESIQKIKELIDTNKIGTIVAFTCHLGQYLPEWHPWEHITDFYVGHRETSGTREMIPFELEWLTWIFGDISKLSCIKGKFSHLDADIDDVYQLIFQFKKGIIGHLLVDVVSRVPTRYIKVIGEKGTIEWNWTSDIVRFYDAETKQWTEFKEHEGFKEKGYIAKENMYIEEIRNFIKAICGEEQYVYSLEEDLKILKLLEAAEESSVKQKQILP